MRYLMTFSYDGSTYNGYQKQIKGSTIQNELEKALKKIIQKKTNIYASGRTDAGVHAINQKAHFDMDKDIPIDNLKKAINSLIPKDIYVKNIEVVDNNFHARFDVKLKQYIYKINLGEYNPIEKNYVYQYNKPLNLLEIKKSLKYLEGTHNFKSFTKANDLKKDYERTIKEAKVSQKDNYIEISFLGTGFMRYMVRNIVGTLIEIGQGKKNSNSIIDILNAKNRRKAGITAPPEGLYLKDVFYK